MDSDLSSVELDEEVYEDSPDVPEEEAVGSEPEEDDEYQYTPDYEEDDESARLKSASRSKRGGSKAIEEEDLDARGFNRKRTANDESEEPGSSPAKKVRRNGAIDLQNLDDDEDEDDGEQAGNELSTESKLNSRNKMMMELLDNSSRRNSKLTENELQLRRAENARKRKNLSEKKLEEEKQDTINKLLRRRAGRTRGPVPADKQSSESLEDEDSIFVKPRRAYNSDGLIRILRNKEEDLYATF
ncbi:LANO_0H04654g1_1 [Lachancea nothofagi CBS 11611]|uniref:LANO_0H04654g1_1 n=1 Tax=Lachancea nothofagi CBS 11611 TaxID=1266666 RepID=A0A1G4KLF1_9SACH|nr:LANO_0H04654g1_1 [Lachancea nothofagi CBS 11611]